MTIDPTKTASDLTRLAGTAATLADRLRHELGGGELTRMASVLAVDLEATALRLATVPDAAARERAGIRLCAMCGEEGADTGGLCAVCEKGISG